MHHRFALTQRTVGLFLSLCLALCLTLGLWLWLAGTESVRAAPQAAPLTVTNNADNGAGSLRDTIAAASAGDTINFAANVSGTILLTTGELVITKDLSIVGSGANVLAIDGNHASRVFNITADNVGMSDLTVQNGNATGNGGGINAANALALTNVNVLSNTATGSGGGAFVNLTTTLSGGVFRNNQGVSSHGGGLLTFGVSQLTGTQFISNTSSSDGGGMYASEAMLMNGGLFANNHCTGASCSGGGLRVSGDLTLLGTQFLSNTANSSSAGVGGGGGGMYAFRPITLTSVVFQNNATNATGGGIFARNTTILSVTQFISNAAVFRGGGLYVESGAATVQAGLFQNNRASYIDTTLGDGGGMYASRALNASGTQFIGNTASGQGGGLYAEATLNLMGAQLLGNQADMGGGVYHRRNSGQIVNSLFARNVATTTGAALVLASRNNAQVLHTTIADSILNTKPAIVVLTGTVGITDTVITSHTIGISQTAGTVSEDYNYFYGNTTNITGTISSGTHHVITGTPNFANPASDDYHLSAGSAAIDVGTDAGVTTDYDGEVRPQGSGFDIGFDESTIRKMYLPLVVR